jgi:hypothetical protein
MRVKDVSGGIGQRERSAQRCTVVGGLTLVEAAGVANPGGLRTDRLAVTGELELSICIC